MLIALRSPLRGFDVDSLNVAAVCLWVAFLIPRIERSRIHFVDLNVMIINHLLTYLVPCGAVEGVDGERALGLAVKASEKIYSFSFDSSVIDQFVRSAERAAGDRNSCPQKGGKGVVVVRRLTKAWLADLYFLGAPTCAVVAI